MRLKPILKWTCTAVAAVLIGLPVATYLVNGSDRPASPRALAFDALLATAPVADDDNGYVHLIGMDAPEGADPVAEGRRRIDRIERAAQSQAFASLTLKRRDYPRLRTPEVTALQDRCMLHVAACAEALRANPALVPAGSVPEQWLLVRYQAMLTRPAWRETPATLDVNAPFIATATAFDGQELLFLGVWTLAGEGDAQGVNRLLQADLQFWRSVLARSDRLVTKMAAIALLTRHFSWANVALKRFPTAQQGDAIPAAWRIPLTHEERSLRKAWAGELAFLRSGFRNAMTVENKHWQQRTATSMFYRTVHLQAIINDHAEFLNDLSDAFDGDYATLARAAEQGQRLEQRSLITVLGKGLYNIGVNMLEGVAMRDFTRYAVRAADLEGIRRAHVLVADLRS